MGQYNNSCEIWDVNSSLSLLLQIVNQKKSNLKIQDIKKKVNGYSWKCQIWMVFFSCADHIPSRLRTSLILLKDDITFLRGIKDVFYLLGLILNLNLLCNKYYCLLLYAFNKYHCYTTIYEASILNSDIVKILIIFEYHFTVQWVQKRFGDLEISRTF